MDKEQKVVGQLNIGGTSYDLLSHGYGIGQGDVIAQLRRDGTVVVGKGVPGAFFNQILIEYPPERAGQYTNFNFAPEAGTILYLRRQNESVQES